MAIDGMSWPQWLAKHRAEDKKKQKVICTKCGNYFPLYYMVGTICDDCHANDNKVEPVEDITEDDIIEDDIIEDNQEDSEEDDDLYSFTLVASGLRYDSYHGFCTDDV